MRTFSTSLILFLLFSTSFGISRDEIMSISSYFNSNTQVVLDAIKKSDTSNEFGKIKKAILLSVIGVRTNDGKSYYEAISLLEEILRNNRNPILIAYLGMNYALVARYDLNPSIKTLFGNRAISTFKEAVNMDSKDWYIRYLRGNVLFEFPEFFKVGNVVKEDFLYLERLIANGELNDPSVLVSIYFFLGEIYKLDRKISKAIEYWKKSVEIGDAYKIRSDEYTKSKKRLEIFLD